MAMVVNEYNATATNIKPSPHTKQPNNLLLSTDTAGGGDGAGVTNSVAIQVHSVLPSAQIQSDSTLVQIDNDNVTGVVVATVGKQSALLHVRNSTTEGNKFGHTSSSSAISTLVDSNVSSITNGHSTVTNDMGQQIDDTSVHQSFAFGKKIPVKSILKNANRVHQTNDVPKWTGGGGGDSNVQYHTTTITTPVSVSAGYDVIGGVTTKQLSQPKTGILKRAYQNNNKSINTTVSLNDNSSLPADNRVSHNSELSVAIDDDNDDVYRNENGHTSAKAIVQFKVDSASTIASNNTTTTNNDLSIDNASTMSSTVSLTGTGPNASTINTTTTTTAAAATPVSGSETGPYPVTTTTATPSAPLHQLSVNHLKVPDTQLSSVNKTSLPANTVASNSRNSLLGSSGGVKNKTPAGSVFQKVVSSAVANHSSIVAPGTANAHQLHLPNRISHSTVSSSTSSSNLQPSYYTGTTAQRMSDLRRILNPEVEEKEDSFKKLSETIENCECFEFNLNNAAKLITVLVLFATLILVIKALKGDR